ncbi:hypothetical protein [Streptomyces sp. NPDC058045]|uniref:hypothetical protein n=1 Tax=Streptomyces sp. NPDC058045 TaxID=3346311 RepID=UPI0036E1AFCA
MSRSSSGMVAGLTVAAVAAVGFLAYQAAASAPDGLTAHPGGQRGPEASASRSPQPKPDPEALPAHSGTGQRVVYSLRADRVWLVGAKNAVQRTFKVAPSAVDPKPGTFAVTSRTNSVAGSDGVPIEHVVRFAVVDGVTIGFSAAVDGSMPDPDPVKRTGGIRERRADGAAMWEFAGINRPVIVVK